MDPRIDWSLPYHSRREGVFARRIVATSQPIACQIGLEVMRSGGNAVDAAIATAASMTVLEPTSNGIGSDAFALVWSGGGLHGLNASGRSPAGMKASDFQGRESIPYLGWGGVTVPGAVSAWVALHERFGTRPLSELLEPAARYAEEGFPVARQTSYYWRRGARSYGEFDAWRETFNPTGSPPRPGDVVTLPDHARTLREIGSSGGELFYRGDLARKIAAAARDAGAPLTEADLGAHEAEWVRPIETAYQGLTLHEIPPNGQGIAALIALGILRHLEIDGERIDRVENVHAQIEAMKLAFADAHRYVADPAHMNVDVTSLLDEEYLASRAALVAPDRAGDPQHGRPKDGGTIYLTVADGDGTMISYIQSNYTGFGSGVVIPGTGISMQNRGCCFTLEEGHPNQAGPNKRPYHTIIPAFVTRDGEPLMSFGVMGGFMQPQGHLQVMVRMADAGQNPQAALDAPRWRVEEGRRVVLEPGFDPAVIERLRELGHEIELADEKTVAHGGGQAILRRDGCHFGASDLRRDGQAVGF